MFTSLSLPFQAIPSRPISPRAISIAWSLTMVVVLGHRTQVQGAPWVDGSSPQISTLETTHNGALSGKDLLRSVVYEQHVSFPVLANGIDTGQPLIRAEASPKASLRVAKLLGSLRHSSEEGLLRRDLVVAEKAVQLAKDTGDSTGCAMAYVAKAHIYEDLGDAQGAFDHWRLAADAWSRISDVPGQIEALASMAVIAVLDPHLGDSGAYLAQVQALAKLKQRRPRATANALRSGGTWFYHQWRLKESTAMYSTALDVLQRYQVPPEEVIRTYINLAEVKQKAGDFPGARIDIQCAQKEIDGHQVEPSLTLEALRSLGEIQFGAGDFLNARSKFDAALHIGQRALQKTLGPASRARIAAEMALCYQDLGVLFADKGELRGSRLALQEAIDLREKFGIAGDTGETLQLSYLTNTLNTIGSVARDQRDLGAARLFYQKALRILRSKAPLPSLMATVLIDLGQVELEEGHLKMADTYTNEGLAIIRSSGNQNSLPHAAALDVLGQIAYRNGDFPEAEKRVQQGLNVQRSLAPSSVTMINMLNDLSVIQLARNDLAGMRRSLQEALSICQQFLGDLSPAALSVAGIHEGIGLETRGAEQGRRGSSDLHQAELHLRLAWNAVRRMGSEISGDRPRIAFMQAYLSYSATLAQVLRLQGKNREALEVVESSRAQALRQAIFEKSLKQVPSSLWRAWEVAKNNENQAAVALTNATQTYDLVSQSSQQQTNSFGTATLNTASREAAQKKAEATQRFIAYRKRSELRWDAVLRSVPRSSPLPQKSLNELVRSFPKGAIAVVFSWENNELVAYWISNRNESGVVVLGRGSAGQRTDREVTTTAQRASLKTEMRSLPTKPLRAVLGETTTSALTTGSYSYATLFPGELGRAVGRAQRVILVPDGALWQVPFAALITGKSNGRPRYLGLEKPLIFAQSLSQFCDDLKGKAFQPKKGSSVLVVGNPSGSNLHFAQQEATSVAKIWGTNAYSGKIPTESWFRRHAPGKSLLHLATHGYYYPGVPSNGWVKLAPMSQRGSHQGGSNLQKLGLRTSTDGTLETWEIMDLRLSPNLVVLSACETAKGEPVEGEGLVGMARAWQMAGAQSLMASQWVVDDEATSQLMTAFYRYWARGKSKDEALRLAMKEVAKGAYANPFYWGSFMLFGDPR